MPVSAADEPATMLYNGVELPVLPEISDENFQYVFVLGDTANTGAYYFQALSQRPWVEDGEIRSPNGTARYSCGLDGENWAALIYSDNGFSLFLNPYPIIWANFNVLNADGSIYLAASDPVDPNAPVDIMEIQTVQPLDDSVSFTVFVSGVDFTSASYTLKYILSVDGQEVKSNVSDPFEDGATGFHGTLYGLTPETTYDLTCVLQKDGVDTSITASATFTTLAGTGSGGGDVSDPDYTGQLDSIEQGIGDVQESVDNVGGKVDGIQDTLTETKEEITSLPGKIASAILDGIKSLFVPSEEDLTEIKDEYESMLSEKLGFVWQAFDLLTTFVGDLQTSLESGEAYEFNFPGVKLPMQGEEFVLVPETPVSLDNDLMDVLRPVLGTVVSMIAVIAFVNMAHDYVLAIVSGVSAYQFERRKE